MWTSGAVGMWITVAMQSPCQAPGLSLTPPGDHPAAGMRLSRRPGAAPLRGAVAPFHRSDQDENWPAWYAAYMVAEQPGRTCPRDRFLGWPEGVPGATTGAARPQERVLAKQLLILLSARDPRLWVPRCGPAAAANSRQLAACPRAAGLEPRVVRRSSSPQSEHSVSRTLPSSRTGHPRRGRAARLLPNAVPSPGVPNALASGEDMTGGTSHPLLHALLIGATEDSHGSPESQCNRPITEW